MAKVETSVIVREAMPSGKKPGGSGRRKALFSEIEDPKKRLKQVEEFWRRRIETDTAAKGGAVADADAEENQRIRSLAVARKKQEAAEALIVATGEGVAALVAENDEILFVSALIHVGRKDRPAVYQAAVNASIQAPAGLARRALKSLIGLDDSPGHRLSREAIKAIEETDPDMFAVAIQNLPATSLVLVADEDTLGVCSPRQLSTLIGMAAGKIFVGGVKPNSQSEAGAERQQQMRVSLGRLLDKVIERDAIAYLPDDPDFGFAEAVAGQISAGQLERLAKGKPPTFTVCKLVELANRKRESAVALVGLLDQKLVAAARNVITAFGDNREIFDEELPDIGTEDYFSMR